MVSIDDKLFYKFRAIIEQIPRLKWMLPHLPIYIGGGMVLFAAMLHKGLNPIPDYDIPVTSERKDKPLFSFQR